MGQVLIRNVDEDVIAAYREAAARNDRSLEAELRYALKMFQPITAARKAQALQRLAELREATRHLAHTPAEVLVREIRDA